MLYSRENELDKLFATLPRYRGMKEDIKEYRQILDDVNEELHNVYLCIPLTSVFSLYVFLKAII